jgi:hypothetical protein
LTNFFYIRIYENCQSSDEKKSPTINGNSSSSKTVTSSSAASDRITAASWAECDNLYCRVKAENKWEVGNKFVADVIFEKSLQMKSKFD